MSSSGLSDISSSLSSDDGDIDISDAPKKGSLEFFFKQQAKLPKKPSPPPRRKRTPSPPHEFVLADNPDIAFICMFRARFGDAFSKSIPHLGPQDIERGVAEPQSTEQVEKLLCALLGLVLNRKKEVERGHFSRALEEAIQTHSSQWPRVWEGKNPLRAAGPGDFHSMNPNERLILLKTLIVWSLSSSEAIQSIIKESYKQQRREDDLNQPLSVQPWGRDGDKRQYWLIEGQDDTHFRLYRETNPVLKHNTWQSVAGDIEEVKQVAEKLNKEDTQAGKRLSDRILSAVPRFEAGEEKRRRRDYRQSRKAQFTRAEPGFSLYEGRTRGKRIKYTYSDEGEDSDALSNRRSTRQSGDSTPAEAAGPVTTFSGRQVKSRLGGEYGESLLRTQTNGTSVNGESGDILQGGEGSGGRSRRSGRRIVENGGLVPTNRVAGYNNVDGMDDESDAASSANSWNSQNNGNDDDEDEHDPDSMRDEDDEMEMSVDGGASEDDLNGRSQSLVVTLRYQKKKQEESHLEPSIGVMRTIDEHGAGTPQIPSLSKPNDPPNGIDEESKIIPPTIEATALPPTPSTIDKESNNLVMKEQHAIPVETS